jgi:hypothetical protein
MGDFNPERLHVGRALKAHRELLGLSPDQLLAVAPANSGHDVRWCERAANLDEQVIRWYHNIAMDACKLAGAGTQLAFGQREQWWTTAFDDQLWHRAMIERRGVYWWWAPRATPRGTGALCYLCDSLIHTYDIKNGATHPMRAAVMTHRCGHHAARRTPEHTTMKGTTL